MSKISNFLINNSNGLIKDEKQADIALIIVIIILVLVSVFFIFSSLNPRGDIEGTQYDPSRGYGGRELPDDHR
jgi:hypothetical protein